jgi:transposase-like protein
MTFPYLCPRCNQGPDLHRIRVEGLNEIIYVCHECDATWFSEDAITSKRHMDYTAVLAELGLDPITAKQTVVDQLP